MYVFAERWNQGKGLAKQISFLKQCYPGYYGTIGSGRLGSFSDYFLAVGSSSVGSTHFPAVSCKLRAGNGQELIGYFLCKSGGKELAGTDSDFNGSSRRNDRLGHNHLFLTFDYLGKGYPKILAFFFFTVVEPGHEVHETDYRTFYDLVHSVADSWSDLPLHCSTQASRRSLTQAIMARSVPAGIRWQGISTDPVAGMIDLGIHGSLLKFNNEKWPFHRLLALHCFSSFNYARSKQQEFGSNEEALNNFRLYVNIALETPFVRSLTATQFIYTFVKHYGESSTHGNNSDRLQVAVEDLSSVILLNRTVFVGELITHVLQLKPQMAAIVGHLLDLARKEQILNIDYIADGCVKMNPSDKYYIQNIVLPYLESCIAVYESNKPIIDQSAAQQRAYILRSVIDHDKEKEVQAINGIQTFVIKLKHPPKMARSLFDLFYDEDCVSDRAFLEWFQNMNSEESNDHNHIYQSVLEFFDWLTFAEADTGEEDDDEHNFHRRSERSITNTE
ncbi:unnamed protein product [Adineta ricciae]|uniref:W2 domain-containing protein n=1 Tax=Adineta ricciae TaxID=249248 RepID=A0A815VW65_ADIRI|nr:unnamed protein product [Adineta ricciae]